MKTAGKLKSFSGAIPQGLSSYSRKQPHNQASKKFFQGREDGLPETALQTLGTVYF